MRMGIGCWPFGDWNAAMPALVFAKHGAAHDRRGSQDFVCTWTGRAREAGAATDLLLPFGQRSRPISHICLSTSPGKLYSAFELEICAGILRNLGRPDWFGRQHVRQQ